MHVETGIYENSVLSGLFCCKPINYSKDSLIKIITLWQLRVKLL